jgi:hypothetical protein
MTETIIPKAPKALTRTEQDRWDVMAWYGALRRLRPGAMPDQDAYDTLWRYRYRLGRLRNGRDDITLSSKEHEIVVRVALDETGTAEETQLQQDFADLVRQHRTRRLRRYCA